MVPVKLIEMREIKFRFWNSKHEHYEFWDHAQHWESLGYYLGGGKVDGYTPEQFTGLKDKNGKEIYEGDIIIDNTDSSPKANMTAIVIINDNPLKVKTKILSARSWNGEETNIFPKEYIMLSYGKYEVIGNIHENKDLLK